MDIIRYVLVVGAGYLLGGVPVGYLAAKLLKGVDVTRIASGRIGTTNTLRAAGITAAAITMIGDAAKGMAATIVGRSLGGTPLAAALAASASVIGHDYPLFLRGAGGVGTITNLGASSMLSGPVAGALAVIGGLVVGISRHSSLGSLSVAILLPVGFLIWSLVTGGPVVYVLHGLISGAVSVWALRPNIKRLRDGTERRIGDKPND